MRRQTGFLIGTITATALTASGIYLAEKNEKYHLEEIARQERTARVERERALRTEIERLQNEKEVLRQKELDLIVADNLFDIFRDENGEFAAVSKVEYDSGFEKTRAYLENIVRNPKHEQQKRGAQRTLLNLDRNQENQGPNYINVGSTLPEGLHYFAGEKSAIRVGEDLFKSPYINNKTDKIVALFFSFATAERYKDGIQFDIVTGTQLYRRTGVRSSIPKEVADDDVLHEAVSVFPGWAMSMRAIEIMRTHPELYEPVTPELERRIRIEYEKAEEVLNTYADALHRIPGRVSDIPDPRPAFAAAVLKTYRK